jgi:hypothetical protein
MKERVKFLLKTVVVREANLGQVQYCLLCVYACCSSVTTAAATIRVTFVCSIRLATRVAFVWPHVLLLFGHTCCFCLATRVAFVWPHVLLSFCRHTFGHLCCTSCHSFCTSCHTFGFRFATRLAFVSNVLLSFHTPCFCWTSFAIRFTFVSHELLRFVQFNEAAAAETARWRETEAAHAEEKKQKRHKMCSEVSIRGTSSQHSGNIESTFREHSINIQSTFKRRSASSIAVPLGYPFGT